MRTGAPRAAVERRLVGGAEHPAQKRRVGAERTEHPDAAGGRARKEAVHLGERKRLVAQKHRRRAALVGGRQHRVAIAEQRVGVLLAQADRKRGELHMGIEAMVLRVDDARREPSVGH